MEILLIDGSYYQFYRYHALLKWWKYSNSDNELGEPVENKLFMERFEKVFISKIKEFIKKLKLINPMIIVANDCHRKDIWRMELSPKYKANREYDSNWSGKRVFEYVTNNLGFF